MIRLLQSTLANLDDIRKILANLAEELSADATLPREQAVQRILIISTLLLERVEGLRTSPKIRDSFNDSKDQPH